jgi:hypothetical protein
MKGMGRYLAYAALPRAGVAERLARLLVGLAVPTGVAMVGFGDVAREGGAGDEERPRRFVSERILESLGVRGAGGVRGTGTGMRVVDSARARVRVGEGGAKGDVGEGTRCWRRLGEPDGDGRFGESGTDRAAAARLGEEGARRVERACVL